MIKVENVVIGGGPGGYVAGIRLAQLGREVLVVEKKRLGGVCLNEGCIPTKALLSATDTIENIEKFKKAGIDVSYKVDVDRLRVWKDSVVDRLVKGVEFLFRANGVGYLKARAEFVRPGVLMTDTGEEIHYRNAIIATGSRPAEIPGFSFGDGIISSSEALDIREVPDRILIIGGGVIGLEMATIYSRLGSKVYVVELMDQILPGIDPDLVKVVEKNLRQRGVEIYTSSKAEGKSGRGPYAVRISPGGKLIEVDRILLSVGRKPNSDGIGLENLGELTDERGFVKTDGSMRTGVDGIYAIGDVRGMPMLAHKAHREGIIAAESIAGEGVEFENRVIPAVVYTSPEVATVGLSEAEARSKGLKVKVGRFPLAANGRAIGMMDYDGFVKIIVDGDTDAIVGAGIVAPHAGELIGELALAMELEATAFDVGFTIHPHPTISEAIMEAAEFVHGRAIHIVNKRI